MTDLKKIQKENANRIKFDGNALSALGAKIALHGQLMEVGGWAFKDLEEFKGLNKAVEVVKDQLDNDVASWVNSKLPLDDRDEEDKS